MKLIYGSVALKHWFPEKFTRESKDIDFISNEEEPFSTKDVESHWVDAFSYLEKNNIDRKYVDKDLLYTIKLSHLSYNIYWEKHMFDVVMMKKEGCKCIDEFYYMLMKDWKKIHKRGNVSLSGKNKDFFKPQIERKYDHDWLHEKFAIHGRPMHERIRDNIDSPKCSKDLWDRLSYEEQLDCAVEELYVLTAERLFFKELNRLPLQIAKEKMLKHMIVSTTSGWFNKFLKENFLELLKYKPKHILLTIQELKK